MIFAPVLCASLLLAGATACAPPPDPPRIAEPATALRPESLRGTVPAEARITDYVLQARLDAEEHSIDATARVTWHNATSRTVDSLPFHLYMNGFRAEDTAWMRSSRGRHRRSFQVRDGAWGYLDVHSVTLEKPGPTFVADAVEAPPVETVALDWSEDADPSTMTVVLPRPVAPGETVTVRLEFTTQLPRVIARTGYLGDFHAVGQWYPKLGVLEDEAGWQNHTFTVYDEFYADFGNYDVILDVPERMVVGATGIRTTQEVSGGRKRLTYAAEMVHDFAWMADPDFLIHDGEARGVRIRQLIQPERIDDAEAHLAALGAAFESYEARYGPYPWSTLTIVHPPKGAEGAGGMEYPTLFTTGDRLAIPPWVRAGVFDERMSGLVATVHEFGHQYFQGLLASREHLEPWLDEGIDTTSNVLAVIDRFGDDPWIVRVLSHKIYLRDFLRSGLRGGFFEPVDQEARTFHRVLGNYGATIYGRTAALMLTLRNLTGHAAFDRAMRAYCDRWRFRHPRGRDLEEILARELGERVNLAPPEQAPVYLEVRSFLDQALRTHHEVDFAVVEVINRRRPGAAGWHRDASGLDGGEPPDHLDAEVRELDDDEVEGIVAIRRAGGFELPVELRVDFEDGGTQRLVWDGRDSVKVFEWPGRRVRRATLDPDHDLLLEWRRLDNTVTAAGLEEGAGLDVLLANLAEAVGLALTGALGP